MCDTVTVSPDASSWQAGFGKLASTLLFAEELSDVKLMANDSDDAISAHRWVLAANSDMMLRMLCPSETSGIKYVEREGHEPVQVGETDATLRSLLSYAYTGRADVAVGNVLAVMKAARYYLVSKGGDCVVACVFLSFSSSCSDLAILHVPHAFVIRWMRWPMSAASLSPTASPPPTATSCCRTPGRTLPASLMCMLSVWISLAVSSVLWRRRRAS
jgi:hypothetical protein